MEPSTPVTTQPTGTGKPRGGALRDPAGLAVSIDPPPLEGAARAAVAELPGPVTLAWKLVGLEPPMAEEENPVEELP